MILTACAGAILGIASIEPTKPIILPLVLHELSKEELTANPPANLIYYAMGPRSTNLKKFGLPSDFKPTLEMPFLIMSKQTLALAETTVDGKTLKRVWIDWNGNDKAEASEFATNAGTLKLFGGACDIMKFAGANKTSQGPVHVQLLVETGSMFAFMPTACGEALETVGDQKLLFRVVDTNMDGRFSSDVDQRGDQIVLMKKSPTGQWVTDRQLPLNSLLWMPDERYYMPTITTDGKNLVLTRDESPLGSLQFRANDLSEVSLKKDQNILFPRFVQGIAPVPEGAYVLANAEETIKGQDGSRYVLKYCGNPVSPIVVKRNQQTVVDLKSPVSLSVGVSNQSGKKQFDLTINTKDGLTVIGAIRLGAESTGIMSKAVQLVIVDVDGKEIDKQTIDVVYDFRIKTSWTPKATDKKGEYTAKVKWATGAFGDLTSEVKFKVD